LQIEEIIMEKPKNVEEYIARQRAAITANPECGTSHYNLAVALLGQKIYDEAERELIEAVNCSPTLAEAYVQLGGICLQRGDLEGCLNYNRQAVKSRAAFAEGWGNIGFVELQKGNIDEAIRALKKAITYNSRFVQAYTTLANAYLMSGLLDESIQANLKALDIEPDFPVVHNNLVICYLEQEDYDKATEHCDRAVELGYPVDPKIIKEVDEHR
jgi:tetratricopeptide (TPR) repeat protein